MNLEQARAAAAFNTARSEAGRADEERKDFLALARSLPAMLQINGLLASWAFLLRRKGTNERLLGALLQHLRGVFPRQTYPLLHRDGATLDNVVLGVGARNDSSPPLTSSQLRGLTAEAIRYATWLKRAAEALCDAGAATPPQAPAATQNREATS
jgi:CRISPR/Cas system CMR-associated protein Cmr5 small subunit